MEAAKSFLKAYLTFATALGVASLAQGQTTSNLVGVWSTPVTLRQDEAWEIADYGCFLGCPASAYEHLRDLVGDPANDARPFRALMVESWRHAGAQLDEILTPQGRARRAELRQAVDDRRACQPLGLVRQILGAFPIEFTQSEDRVVLRYEQWEVVRTIYTDGRGHPEDLEPSLYGHSVGRFEGGALVVETEGIAPNRFYIEHGGGGHSDQLKTVERYTRSDDGRILRLELILEDPVMLSEPLVYEKLWRFTPDVGLLEYSCETIAGQP